MSQTTALREVARTDLCRTAPFMVRADAEADAGGDGFTIDGYATVYGRDVKAGEDPTEADGWAFIDSWEGTFWERFRFGAFKKSLRERLPRMQFDHGRHPLLGSLPLGRWNDVTEEEDAGLHTVGRLSDNWLVQPFRESIRDEAVDGMSIRFGVVRDEWRDVDGKIIRETDEILQLLWRPDDRGPLRRSIIESKLSEAGPVTWPAYEQTSVGVRSVTIDLGRLRDPAQRALLARAVILTDAADGDDSPPRTTDPDGAAGEHRDDTATSTTSTTDTPRTTPAGAGAGEHESHPPTERLDDVDRWRLGLNRRPAVDALAEVNRVLAAIG